MGFLGFGKDERREATADSDLLATAAGRAARGEPLSALERAEAEPQSSGLGGAATKLITRLLDLGIDGKGPLDSADAVAEAVLATRGGDSALKEIEKSHRRMVAVGGFVTGLGGFVTMAVSLPANVVEFYVLSTRMVAAMARVRGYDLADPHVRTAVLLTLTGTDSDDILKKVGLQAAGGRLTSMATSRLPAPALMVLNKAVGFRLIARAGGQTLARFGRAVPVAGGVLGAGLDVYLLGKIADQARAEFPARPSTGATV